MSDQPPGTTSHSLLRWVREEDGLVVVEVRDMGNGWGGRMRFEPDVAREFANDLLFAARLAGGAS